MAYLRMTIVIALTCLPDSSRKDARWVRGAWFAHKAPSLFDAITADEAKSVRPERNSRLMRSPFATSFTRSAIGLSPGAPMCQNRPNN